MTSNGGSRGMEIVENFTLMIFMYQTSKSNFICDPVFLVTKGPKLHLMSPNVGDRND
jgi:hypothetical protein